MIFWLKVDLYSGCDSDAKSNTIVAMEKRYYCESLLFCCIAIIIFSSCCLEILKYYFMISDGNYSAKVGISLESKKKMSTLVMTSVVAPMG